MTGTDDIDVKPRTMRVAVVEDEDLISGFYVAGLKSAGHEVWVADRHDPRTIGDPDVVILDLMMPDVDGCAIAEWLTHHKPDVRKVVATAMYQVPGYIRDVSDIILIKPFSLERLIDAIEGIAS